MQEGDRLDIFAATEFVGDPFAFATAVIEIEHGGDSIHPQSVDAIAVEPEQRVGEQKIRNLGAPVIIDERVPIKVASLHRIFVLVDGSAIETREPVWIVGKMA